MEVTNKERCQWWHQVDSRFMYVHYESDYSSPRGRKKWAPATHPKVVKNVLFFFALYDSTDSTEMIQGRNTS
jgi:hypothetical protein